MKKTMIALLAVTPFALLALPAAAEENETACTTEPAVRWMSQDAARAKAADMGYDVRDIKIEHGCFEIHALKGGARVQMAMNPVDGAIVAFEGEDDE